MPLNMAPPCEWVISAVLGPNHGSCAQSVQPLPAPMRRPNSSLAREREYVPLRRAQERGTTAFHFNMMINKSHELARSTLTGAAASTRPSNPLPACQPTNATCVVPYVRFARARIKPIGKACTVFEPPIASIDPCMHALVLGMWLVVAWCVCAVILDLAMAVFAALLHLATAPPVIYMHAILCFMNMCMSIITTPHVIPLIVSMTFISLVPLGDAAGQDTPKTNTFEYFLPGVSRWDGLPFHDFRRIWWVALCAALGSVSQDSYSLLQTARDQDLGSPATGGTAAQRTQSDNRNQRLFGSILNYIEHTSYIYRYASAHFNNNGRGLFEYLYVYGHLPYTAEQRTELENEWTDATMSKVGIKYTEQAVFKWAEYVTSLAEKIGKTEREKRVKYLNGFPSSFDVVVVPERQRGAIGSYSHPLTYPAHDPRLAAATADAARHTAAANAATTNGDAATAATETAAAAAALRYPNAGEPDLFATAHGFYPEWARMTRLGMIRSVPRGMANQAHEISSDEHDDSESASLASALLARARVSLQTVCLVCGGIGHAANIDGVGQCLTARLGHRVPPSDLNRIQYPDGYTPPRFGDRSSNHSRSNSNSHSHTRHSNSDSRRYQEGIFYPTGPPRSGPPRPSRPSSSRPYARAVETDYDSSSNTPPPAPQWTEKQEQLYQAMANPPWMSEPPLEGEEELAARLHHEHHQRRRQQRRNPNPRTRQPIHPRARQANTPSHPSQETSQNSYPHDADDYNDPDEHHGRLAVAFDEIDFP